MPPCVFCVVRCVCCWCAMCWRWCWCWCVTLTPLPTHPSLRVYVQNALRVCIHNVPVSIGTKPASVTTCGRGAGTHGDVLMYTRGFFSVPHHTARTHHDSRDAQEFLTPVWRSSRKSHGLASSLRERRAQRARAKARFAGRLCKMVELWRRGFAPSHALMRVMADSQERVSERIVEQTADNPEPAVDAPVPQAMEGIVEGDVAFALAVTYAAPSTVIGYVGPTPAVTYAEPATATAFVEPSLLSPMRHQLQRSSLWLKHLPSPMRHQFQ